MVRMDSFSSVPPHIQPPMAHVPSAIRELTRFVPSISMYSIMVVLSGVELPFAKKQRIECIGPITLGYCRLDPPARVFPFAESPPKNLAPALHPIALH